MINIQNNGFQILKQLRKKCGYSQNYVAKQIGISKAFYSQIENQNKRLSYNTAIKIAKVFKRKPDSIFYKDTINYLQKKELDNKNKKNYIK